MTQSDDVRLRNVHIGERVNAAQSRLEMGRYAIRGRDGGPGGLGYEGIGSSNGNRLHLALTSVTGGSGGDSSRD